MQKYMHRVYFSRTEFAQGMQRETGRECQISPVRGETALRRKLRIKYRAGLCLACVKLFKFH